MKKGLKVACLLCAAMTAVFAVGCDKNEEETPTMPTVKEEGKTVHITINDTVAGQEIVWSATWKNAESEWATGKNVADYVRVEPAADGLSAEIIKLKTFSETIIVRAKVAGTDTCYADISVECERVMNGFDVVAKAFFHIQPHGELEDGKLVLKNFRTDGGVYIMLTASPKYEEGTKDPKDLYTSPIYVRVRASEELKAALGDKVTTEFVLSGVSITLKDGEWQANTTLTATAIRSKIAPGATDEEFDAAVKEFGNTAPLFYLSFTSGSNEHKTIVPVYVGA
ncbi:MAG: hypothetical protein IJV80_03725 [Clostridia bacterium]|nr:hypothetical protein [Clostridia bacterium]